MTPAQFDQIKFLQELHQGWAEDDMPIGVLHSRWLLERLGELETAMRRYCDQTTIGSPHGADGLRGASAHHDLYREYFERVLAGSPPSGSVALPEQITRQYQQVEALEQKLASAKQQLQALLHMNSFVRELGGQCTVVDNSP